MSKFALLVALAMVVMVQGYPQKEAEISEAAGNGDWDLVHKLIQERFKSQNGFGIWEPSQSAANIRSLKAPPGGHVFAEAEYTFKSSTNENGQKVENKGGHRIVNKDGVISEYDIQPTV